MQVGTAAARSPACPRVPAGPAASRRSTHVAEEAELVVLPAKAPVVRPRRSPLLAPAKAAGAGSGHGPTARQLQHPLPCPCPISLTARWGRTGSVLQLTSAARRELSSIRAKHGALNPLLGVLATKPTHFTRSALRPHERAASKRLERQPRAPQPRCCPAGRRARAWPSGTYPDSNPGRGSLKVVVRVLWSTK